MTKGQGKTYEYCVRLEYPMKKEDRGLSDDEHIRMALEAFESKLSENGKPLLKILRTPILLFECNIVTLVFSVWLEQPEPADMISELRKQIPIKYFDTFPPEWTLSIVSKIVDDKCVPYSYSKSRRCWNPFSSGRRP